MTEILWPNGGTRRPNLSAEGHFGWRNASTPGASKYHRGQDMWGLGIVRSIADGEVVFVGWGYLVGWGGGYQVWIQHDGFFTRSLHMQDGSAPVSKGQRVSAGDAIGVEGHTGTYADHLHLEITPGNWHTRNEGQVDPVPFIEARITTGAPAGVEDNEEDDMPLNDADKKYIRDTVRTAINELVWQAKVGRGDRRRTVLDVVLETNEQTKNLASRIWGATLGRGERRRTTAQILASIATNVEAAPIEEAKPDTAEID